MSNKNIIIGSDHAGVELKSSLVAFLKKQGYQIHDCGTDTAESVDYPDFAYHVADKMLELSDQVPLGVLICGSGVGISIAANRNKHIRAALCYNEEIATLSRQHNDANVIVLGARFITDDEAIKFVERFIQTEFEGGRHARRVNKLS